jgi:hypothetical protein
MRCGSRRRRPFAFAGKYFERFLHALECRFDRRLDPLVAIGMVLRSEEPIRALDFRWRSRVRQA